MNVLEMKEIDILNYNSFSITIQTKDANKLIPSMKNNEPGREQLSPSEIKYIHNQGNAFKDGLLCFPKDIEKEVYEEILRIKDWQNILQNDDIKEIILNPTTEGLSRIVNCESPMVFDRVRAIYTNMINQGTHNISYRVIQVLDDRFKEIQNKIYKTKIDLTNKKLTVDNSSSEVNNLKEQNEKLQDEMKKQQEQMIEMQKQMTEFMKQNNNEQKSEEKKEEEIKENSDGETKESQTKSIGKQSKSTATK